MCLVVEKDSKKVAKSNILCYKHGQIESDGVFRVHTRYFGYRPNQENKLIKLKEENTTFHFINEGYHSYKSVTRAFKERIKKGSVGVFVIPRNIDYYEGGHNSAVEVDGYTSAQLIYLGNVFNPLTWLKVLEWKLVK